MDIEQFVTFRRFNDREATLAFAEFFKVNNIEVLLEDVSANFDVTFANNELDKDYRVKLKPGDFEKANRLLMQNAAQELGDLDPSYYLFSFDNEELKEIVEKQDEWSSIDFLLAQKLLKDRGISLNPNEIDAFKSQRIEELSAPEKSPKFLIIAGYLLVFLGGLFGLLIGWYIRNLKKTLPNGEPIFSYAEADRIHGERIMILGIIGLVVYIAIRFL